MFLPHFGIDPVSFTCWYVPQASVIASVHSGNVPTRSRQYSKQQYVVVIDRPHGGSVPLRPPCDGSLQPQKLPSADSSQSLQWCSHICGRETRGRPSFVTV